jgi:formylmethanofuran:tetrahydromethanopterin formyltransferase
MTVDRQAERDAIQAAAGRLLAGAPTRSTGALTVLQLAAEAGVKRWVLTHKHPDLRQAFVFGSATDSGARRASSRLTTSAPTSSRAPPRRRR